MPNTILIIEDDDDTAAYVSEALLHEGFSVERCNDGVSGLERAKANQVDAIILDRLLPGMDGMSLLRAMRAAGIATPVLMLSSLGSVFQRVDGLLAGSNDYLAKPFEIAELVARIRVLLRDSNKSYQLTTRLHYDQLKLNRVEHSVRWNNEPIALQPREFRLLAYLMLHVGQTVTRKMLLEGVWDCNFDPGTNVIEVHISRLRKKLDEATEIALLHTVRGVGYRFGEGE